MIDEGEELDAQEQESAAEDDGMEDGPAPRVSAKERLEGLAAELAAAPDMKTLFPSKHARIVREMDRAARRVAERQAEKQEREDQDTIARMEAGDTSKTDAIRQEMADEIERLRELGFDGDEPEDLDADTVALLRAQRLVAEDKVDDAFPILERQLQALRAPESTMALLRQFRSTADLDGDLAEGILDQVLRWIHREHTERKQATKKATTDEENEQ